MANTKISALPSGSPALATDQFPIARAGSNFSLQSSDLWTAVDIRDYNPHADGVTDDTTAFNAAAAAGKAIALTPGKSYFIGTNLTLSVPVYFNGGAKVVVGSGFTVTFNGQVYAPTNSQAFVVNSPIQLNQTGMDTLHRANESPISDGGKWTIPTGFGGSNDGGTLVNNVWNPVAADKWSAAFWNPQGAIGDQWASIEVGVTPPLQSQYIVVCRASTIAQTYYYMLINGSNGQIGKSVNGTGTTLATFSNTLNPGDVMTLVVQGTTLTAYVNGTQKAQATDSAIATGLPGMGMFSHTVTTNTSILGFTTGVPVAAVAGGSVVIGPNTPAVYPEWFGAKGDYNWGTAAGTDDTNAIQAAITSVSSSGLGYGLELQGSGDPKYAGQVVLNAKSYLTSAGLVLQASNVRITGAGRRSTAIVCTNPSATILSVQGTTPGGATLTNLGSQLRYFAVARLMPYPTAVTNIGIKFSWSLLTYCEQVESWDSTYCWQFVQVGGHNDLTSCFANNTGISPSGQTSASFYVTAMTSSRFIDCIGEGTFYGIYGPSGGADFFVEGFETAAISHASIFLAGGWTDTIIMRPICEGGGIQVSGAVANIIQIYGGYYNGSATLIVSGSGVNIYGGQFTSGNSSGIIQISGNQNSVVGCFIQNATGSATPCIVVAGSDNVISGNNISGASGHTFSIGISLVGATRNVIVGNALSGFGTTGLNYDATSNNNASTGNVVDTTNITTAKTDAGTGNTAGI